MKDKLVFILDDNVADAQLVVEALEATGFVGSVVSFEEPAALFSDLHQRGESPDREAPDMIVLDLNMPQVDGHVVLEVLKSDVRWRDIPVVMFSSSRQAYDEQRAIALGARRYIAKPTTWDGYVDVGRELLALPRAA
jgi:CheY-like chemotaxis protein